jgi:putative NADH-flavin reductase
MTITVFGATGLVGKHVVTLALGNNITVKAFGRNVDSLIDSDIKSHHQLQAIKGYVFDETEVLNAIKGSDAVISVLGGSFDGMDKTRSLGIKNIIQQMQKANVKRIVALGGMGILNATANTLIIDSTDYPEIYLPVGKEHLEAYHYLQASQSDWTFVCAPDITAADADGKYITATDYPPTPNQYKINAGNIAMFMLNELEKNEYIHHRVGISNS